MKIDRLPEDKKHLIEQLVKNYYRLHKQENKDGWVVTENITPKPAYDNQQVFNINQEFEECRARELIVMVDFMAVANPDNINTLWCNDVANIASYLRKHFYKAFGKSVYA
ncbi:hypothetical protein [Agarilytica rhodophyticola]|uniref:hypothetical protein n=1 Tax=Agarilytica rhodophyticola TaxID=1737490 RepID=UPI001319C97A|nr:hypothetical protein [Agarilytica rhodophyticola]